MTRDIQKAARLLVLGTALCLLAACGSSHSDGTLGLSSGGVSSGSGGNGGPGGGSGGGTPVPAHALSAVIGGLSQYFGTVDPEAGSVNVLTGAGISGYRDFTGLAYDPGGRTLYGFVGGENQLITVDPQSGRVTTLGPLAGAVHLQALAAGGDGSLYGIDGNGALVKVDPNELMAAAVGTGVGHAVVADLTYDAASGLFYGVAPGTPSGELFSVDPATGAGADIGPLPQYLERLAVDTDTGQLFALDRVHGTLASVDKTSAAITKTFPAMAYSLPGPMTYLPQTQRLVTVGRYKDYGGNILVAIEPGTGAAAVAADIGFQPVSGMAYDASSGTVYASDGGGGRLLRLDTATGQGSEVGEIGFSDVEALAWDDADGVLYGVDLGTHQLITIDAATGAGKAVAAIGSRNIRSLCYRTADGLLYAVDLAQDGSATLVSIDPAGDVVSVVSPLATSGGVGSLAYDPAEDAAYAVMAEGTISHLWRWDFATGKERLSEAPLLFASAMTFDADKGVLLADDNDTGALVSIDPSAGSSAAIDNTGFVGLTGLTYDPDAARDYAVAGSLLVALDPATGSGTPLVPLQGVQAAAALAYDSDSQVLYGYDGKQGAFVTIDPGTGAAAPLGGAAVPGVTAMAFDRDAAHLYAQAGGQLYSVDTATGAATAVGGPAAAGFTDMAYDASQHLLYGIAASGNGAQLYTVDTRSGAATPVQTYDYRVTAIAAR